MIKSYWQKGGKQKRIVIISAIVLVLLLFFLRDDYQPALLFLRKYVFIILISTLFLWFMLRRFRASAHIGKRILYLVGIAAFFGVLWFAGWKTGLYQYMQTYNVYNNLDLVEIHELPLTQNERIQPYNNIVTMAYESIGETQEVSPPQLVRIDTINQWTMAVQPAKEYSFQRMSDNTEELFTVESTSPFPRFTDKSRVPVTFSIGESLAFSRNTYNAVVQRFNFFQLFTLEPSQVYYMKNDDGKWVQVVNLIKWKGFFFPYPSYGGVMIIESGEHTAADYLERITIGKGTYVPPSKTQDYPFLTKQNTLSEEVSRLQAKSLQFLGGFTDPLPWNMETAVKIPDLKDDENQQPFVTDFNWSGMETQAYSGLYHWFGLEPIGEERTSLSFSVLIPGDGTDKVYYYNHAAKKEGLAGVSAMPLKVVESRKEYDWSVNKPVEFRPFIKEIAGRKRMFVISTIAAKRDDSKKFDGAATPDLALIDTEYRDVIWVDAKHPSQWESTIIEQLGETWKSDEGLTDEDLYPNRNDIDVEGSRDLNAIIEATQNTIKEDVETKTDSIVTEIKEVVKDSLLNDN
ncbi:hypothetical protein GCM10011344_01140 [Dokdonia pacifica]|uniref:Uncharacterized protein n=1 Tax=Dokdonia pacifica TaxID=1627892 RepID=A0A239CXT8_9FLAO|nr:hypothetical protein [Dokdonia pacifica]GGG04540.1 hypothetical protein GCM10011344_01140 [Dokdonia pacifica]SNS24692.1 hypothetical protein SAMN06265376_10926 [Dokdonia pacifica]